MSSLASILFAGSAFPTPGCFPLPATPKKGYWSGKDDDADGALTRDNVQLDRFVNRWRKKNHLFPLDDHSRNWSWFPAENTFGVDCILLGSYAFTHGSFFFSSADLAENMSTLQWGEGRWRQYGNDLETALQSQEAQSCSE